ncbi:hypothetical protein ACSSS7_004869 [Eimeria intestinalis]
MVALTLSNAADFGAAALPSRSCCCCWWLCCGFRAVLLLEGAKYIMEKHGGEPNQVRQHHQYAALLLLVVYAQLPSSLEELQAIPGVGPYTSGAIGALAFGLRVPAVDGNVTRVFCRVLGSSLTEDERRAREFHLKLFLFLAVCVSLLHLFFSPGRLVSSPTKGIATPSEPRTQQQIIPRFVTALLPEEEANVWTEASIELGATVCLPRSPACTACPVRPWCIAAAEAEGRVTRTAHCGGCRICVEEDSLKEVSSCPAAATAAAAAAAAAAATYLRASILCTDSEGRLQVLLEQRSPEGLLARQWGPPTLTWGAPKSEGKVTTSAGSLSSTRTKEAKRFLTQEWADLVEDPDTLRYLGSASHQFSHQSHTIHVFTTRLSRQRQQQQQQQQRQHQQQPLLQRRWATMEETKALLTCSYFQKQLAVLEKHLRGPLKEDLSQGA